MDPPSCPKQLFVQAHQALSFLSCSLTCPCSLALLPACSRGQGQRGLGALGQEKAGFFLRKSHLCGTNGRTTSHTRLLSLLPSLPTRIPLRNLPQQFGPPSGVSWKWQERRDSHPWAPVLWSVSIGLSVPRRRPASEHPGHEPTVEQHSSGRPPCATHRCPAAIPSAAHVGNLVVSTS